MKTRAIVSTIFLIAASSCGGGITTQDNNSVTFALEVPGADGTLVFQTVDYVLKRDDGTERKGQADVSSSTRPMFVVGGVAPGAYTMSVASTATDIVTMCLGTSDAFTVVAGMTTPVALTLSCKQPKRNGSVIVNGKLNVCPLVDDPSANPSESVVGGSIALDTGAVLDTDNGPNPVTGKWTATPAIGTFDDPTAPATKFHCTGAGAVALVYSATDGDPACSSSGKVTVYCTSTCPKDDGDPCTTDTCLPDGSTSHTPSDWPGCTAATEAIKLFCPDRTAPFTDAEAALVEQCSNALGQGLAQGGDADALFGQFLSCAQSALMCGPSAMSESDTLALSTSSVCNQAGFQACALTAFETFAIAATACTVLAGAVVIIPPLNFGGSAAAYVLCILGATVTEDLMLRLCVAHNSCTPPQICDHATGTCVDAGIKVVSATYGPICGNPQGNVTGAVKSMCDGKPSCDVFVHNNVFGDPSFGCAKDFVADYQCDGDPSIHTASHGPVAGEGYTVSLTCP